MAQFDPNIFLRGAAMSQRQNENLVDTFQNLSDMYVQSQQRKQAELDVQRKDATKIKDAERKASLSEQGIYEQISRAGVESLDPEQRQAAEFYNRKRASELVFDPSTQRQIPKSAPLLDLPQGLQQGSPMQQYAPAAPQALTPEGIDLAGASPKTTALAQKMELEEQFAERASKKAVLKDRPNVEKNFRNVSQEMEDLDSYIDEAIEKSNFWSTGFGAESMAEVGGTEAANFSKVLERIQSSTVLDKMAQMKAQSSTGATGFGAMNKSELGLLLNARVALAQSQSEEEFDKNAKKLKVVNARIKNNMAEDYKNIYGDYPKGFKPTEVSGGMPPDKQARLRELRAKRDAGGI